MATRTWKDVLHAEMKKADLHQLKNLHEALQTGACVLTTAGGVPGKFVLVRASDSPKKSAVGVCPLGVLRVMQDTSPSINGDSFWPSSRTITPFTLAWDTGKITSSEVRSEVEAYIATLSA